MSPLHRRARLTAATLLLWVVAGTSGTAQTRTFTARLSPVPITVAMQDAVAGVGSATAVLNGDRLTIEGTFRGLKSPATVARLHVAAPAMRGEAFADVPVPPMTDGAFKATVQLSARQREALEKRSVYLQIHSAKAPDGNLWGWFFPPEDKQEEKR